MEIQEIIANIEVDKSQRRVNKEGIKSILGSKGNRHRLWIGFVTAVGSQCAGSGLISAYLPTVLELVGFSSTHDKTLINGIVNIWSWAVGVIAALVMPRMKRRNFFLASASGMLITFIIWTALSAEFFKN